MLVVAVMIINLTGSCHKAEYNVRYNERVNYWNLKEFAYIFDSQLL
jgi:hypothetical protein